MIVSGGERVRPHFDADPHPAILVSKHHGWAAGRDVLAMIMGSPADLFKAAR
jgi:hypothetical protein